MDTRFAALNQNVINEIRNITDRYDRTQANTTDTLLHKIRLLESRTNDLEQWRFHYTLFTILVFIVLVMPDIFTML